MADQTIEQFRIVIFKNQKKSMMVSIPNCTVANLKLVFGDCINLRYENTIIVKNKQFGHCTGATTQFTRFLDS